MKKTSWLELCKGGKEESMSNFSWWKTGGAVVLLYAAMAIALPAQTLTTIVNLDGSDGSTPLYGSLVQGLDGNFYGTTVDGTQPEGGLVQATTGTLYGTTDSGGTDGYGTVFSLAVGLGAFVETLPTSGKVGAAVKILGTNLTGATSVRFNGTAATFTVVSRSLITTTVPTGATTGTVQVVTPSRTLNSNLPFRVLP